ncbi:21093_t:CDS:2, partial [Cetraspora pellucida]
DHRKDNRNFPYRSLSEVVLHQPLIIDTVMHEKTLSKISSEDSALFNVDKFRTHGKGNKQDHI